MKVLQVLSGKAWGGGSVVVLAIARALIARGDEVWVYTYEQETGRRFAAAGAKLVRPPFWIESINPLDAIILFSLWRVCRREKFDLVATHTSKGGFLGRLAARLAGVPHIVHHAHGFSFNKVLSPLTRRFYIALERFAARAGDMIISVNDEHRSMAIELGIDSPDRIRTVHNGIDVSAFGNTDRKTARRNLGFDDAALLIGAIGRLSPQKGYVYLIQAFRMLSDWFPSARLVVAGIGPLANELDREAHRLGVANRVDFLGFRRDIAGLLAAFDVYAQPSLWEGHSISLIEALAAGKPIVATNIDGNREVVDHGETGLLVPAADPGALADALERLLKDTELARQLGTDARRAAMNRFSQEEMVRRNLEAYDWVRAAPNRKRRRRRPGEDKAHRTVFATANKSIEEGRRG